MLQPQQHSIPEGVRQTKNSTAMIQLLRYAEWVIISLFTQLINTFQFSVAANVDTLRLVSTLKSSYSLAASLFFWPT
ncbi:hypothetical protein [Acinetobacter sp. MF4640]|uniref:hypothetical protein n=1 Tax=Acinetobacter TaxID=469 RepID=UPI001D0CF3E0|nr:hypothetical protein [Acinetobacter sp. MF4640]